LAGRGVTHALLAANVLAYLVAMALSGPNIRGLGGGMFSLLGPAPDVSAFLGVLDPIAVRANGEVWRLVTSMFLHVGALHIFFNMSWLRSIGPVLEQEFGSFRFACVYIGSGSCGALACLAVDQGALGASGAVFGLIGAGWAHGKRRGGVWGAEVRKQFMRWALVGVLFTFVMAGHVSVPGHLGGLAGGALLGWLSSPQQRRYTMAQRDAPWIVVTGGALLASVPLSFAAAVAFGFLAPSRASIPYLIGGSTNYDEWPLEPFDLTRLGAPGWNLGIPRGWERLEEDSRHVALDGGLGMNLLVRCVEWPRGLSGTHELLAWASSAPVEQLQPLETGGAALAAIAPVELPGEVGFVSVHELGTDQVLLVQSRASTSVDREEWIGLCLRVVESAQVAGR
jgi:rhomboid protease GluP